MLKKHCYAFKRLVWKKNSCLNKFWNSEKPIEKKTAVTSYIQAQPKTYQGQPCEIILYGYLKDFMSRTVEQRASSTSILGNWAVSFQKKFAVSGWVSFHVYLWLIKDLIFMRFFSLRTGLRLVSSPSIMETRASNRHANEFCFPPEALELNFFRLIHCQLYSLNFLPR